MIYYNVNVLQTNLSVEDEATDSHCDSSSIQNSSGYCKTFKIKIDKKINKLSTFIFRDLIATSRNLIHNDCNLTLSVINPRLTYGKLRTEGRLKLLTSFAFHAHCSTTWAIQTMWEKRQVLLM